MTIAAISLGVGVFCGGCLGAIPGIIAVVNASKVKGLAAAGNHGGAQEAAANARKWARIGFIVTAVLFVLAIGLNVLAAASSSSA